MQQPMGTDNRRRFTVTATSPDRTTTHEILGASPARVRHAARQFRVAWGHAEPLITITVAEKFDEEG